MLLVLEATFSEIFPGSFLNFSGYLCFFSCALLICLQNIIFVFLSPAIPALSECVWRHSMHANHGCLWAQACRLVRAPARFSDQRGLSAIHPAREARRLTASNNPLHVCGEWHMQQGLPVQTALANSERRHQYLVSLFSHTSALFQKKRGREAKHRRQVVSSRQACVRADMAARRPIALCWDFTVLITTRSPGRARHWETAYAHAYALLWVKA